jgi:hypothetical protein
MPQEGHNLDSKGRSRFGLDRQVSFWITQAGHNMDYMYRHVIFWISQEGHNLDYKGRSQFGLQVTIWIPQADHDLNYTGAGHNFDYRSQF